MRVACANLCLIFVVFRISSFSSFFVLVFLLNAIIYRAIRVIEAVLL